MAATVHAADDTLTNVLARSNSGGAATWAVAHLRDDAGDESADPGRGRPPDRPQPSRSLPDHATVYVQQPATTSAVYHLAA